MICIRVCAVGLILDALAVLGFMVAPWIIGDGDDHWGTFILFPFVFGIGWIGIFVWRISNDDDL